MERIFRLLLMAVLVVSLSFVTSGCARKSVGVGTDSAATESRDVSSGMAATEESLGSSSSHRAGTRRVLEGRTSVPLLPVYFDFDKHNIRKDQVARIRKNSATLKSNSGMRITIEGNCDERGTSEYNMALGERRAQSAKKYMVNLGIASKRIKTISYGEERPLLHGHDEYSWAQNRRDDFVIK